MTKSSVTRLFIASLIAFGTGAVVAIIALLVALASNVLVTAGTEILAVRGSVLAWGLLGLGIGGGIAMLGGVIAGLVAWIGALLNTSQHESKAWFIVLLLTGIFNFGFIAMIAYVIAGPDGTARATAQRSPAASGA
jgi:hypothetical protein